MSKFDDVVHVAVDVVTALAPIVSAAVPGSGAAFDIGFKILKGALDAEPTARALFNRIQSGEIPTAAELEQFESDYEASYQKLNADLIAGGATA